MYRSISFIRDFSFQHTLPKTSPLTTKTYSPKHILHPREEILGVIIGIRGVKIIRAFE